MILLLWDDWNTQHIAEHSVVPEEAREVVERATRPFPRRLGPARYLVRGQTKAGRYLQVVYVIRTPESLAYDELSEADWVAVEAGAELGYVIHARDLRAGEIRTVRKRTD